MSEQKIEMKIDSVRAKHLVSNLQHISERIAKASKGRNVSFGVPIHFKVVPGDIRTAPRCKYCQVYSVYEGVVPGP